MAIDVTARDAMVDALSGAGLDAEAQAVIDWLESLRHKNQHNSEVIAELDYAIANIDPTEV